MAIVAQLCVAQCCEEGRFNVMRIALLKFSEVLGRFLPFALKHVEPAKLKSSLRVHTVVSIFVKPESILQIICSLGIAFTQLHAFDVCLKSTLGNLCRFLDDLILRVGQRLVALVEDLVGKTTVNIL